MLDVKSMGDGRFLVREGAHQRVAYAVKAGSICWIFLAGRTYALEPGARTRNPEPGTRNDDHSLAAPMPAAVSSIRVKPGDQVARGDVLVMLEAMKMELPITAPRNGRVKAVACREGELVQPGVPLVELD